MYFLQQTNRVRIWLHVAGNTRFINLCRVLIPCTPPYNVCNGCLIHNNFNLEIKVEQLSYMWTAAVLLVFLILIYFVRVIDIIKECKLGGLGWQFSFCVLYLPGRKKEFKHVEWWPAQNKFEGKPQVPMNNLRAGVFAPNVKEKHWSDEEQRHHQDWNWTPT